MKNLIEEAQDLLRKELAYQKEMQQNIDSSNGKRQDALDDWLANISTYKNLVDRVFNKQLIRRLLDNVQGGLINFNKQQIEKSYEKFAGVDLLQFSDDIVGAARLQTENSLSLIEDLGEDIKEKIEKQVFRGMREGLRHEQLMKRIEKSLTGGKKGVFKSVKNRAKLIARNEVSSFNATLTKQRNENLGIKFYRWVTAKDNRVRDDGGPAGAKNHADLDGRVFPWGDSPVTFTVDGKKYKFNPAPKGLFGDVMFPGNEINCRCVARSLINLELEELIRDLAKSKNPKEVVRELQK